MIVFTVLLGLSTLLGFVGNLLVLLVVILYRDFRHMRYFLLASLALSDWIVATLVAGSRTMAIAAEKWTFGTTWCHGAAFIIRVLHHSTCFHLCAVSHERYDAIVRRPLNYSSRITKKRASIVVILLWILPVLISLAPFLGWGDFVYNPDIFTCEQKWDGQTAIPMSIVTFLVPIGVIFILNYQVLKVVHRLQRSAEIINKGVSEPESDGPNSKTQDSRNQQQCFRDDVNPKQHDGQEKHQNGSQKVVTTSPQLLSVIVRNMLSSHRNEGEENPAYQPEPDDYASYKNEVVCERRNVRAAKCLTVRPVDTREDGPNQINNNKGKRGYKVNRFIVHLEKRCTLPQEVEQDQEEMKGKMDSQIHLTEANHQRRHATLEDGSGSPKSVCEAPRQKETKGQKGSIKQPSSDDITAENSHYNKLENASGTKGESSSRVNDQKQHPGRKLQIIPLTAYEQALTEARTCRMNSGKEKHLISSSSHGTSQNNLSENLKYQIAESLAPAATLQLNASHAHKRRRPPGRTQMRLSKLLIEGKAARDVVIIISAFVLCYLPLWIMAMYRAAGGTVAVEAILSTHWLYSLSTVCNPIIYSVRKREFRKTLRKMLKL